MENRSLDPLLTCSGTRLARMIREREVTSAEVVEAHLRRIEQVNPVLNAVVHRLSDRARAEARAADELTRRAAPEALPPFHGVPCTIKESFSQEGCPHTAGLKARQGVVATTDATTVSRLRRAGAIPLGCTNVSELCMWMESYNRVYGRTGNPYDPRRTAGGSSGGEGAIIGAGGSPFGLGSDIGGSIRLPAFFNGVFGHKPTGRMVPFTGQYPIPENEVFHYVTTGPLARRAEDLMPLLRIFAGPDGMDPRCVPFELGDPAGVDLRTLHVLDVEDNGVTKVSDDLRAAQRRCAGALARRGARVEKARIASLGKSFDIWSNMMATGAETTYSSLLGNGTPIRLARELGLYALGRSEYTLPSLILVSLEKLTKLFPERQKRFVALGRALREELVARIGPRGVMLYPSYSMPAPLHNQPMWHPFDWVYTAIMNVMELPSTQVPLGLNAQGIPLGVQVAAVHGNDHLSIAVALALEADFGGWVPPAPTWASAGPV
jgi:fatty acid amide hydrolase 2